MASKKVKHVMLAHWQQESPGTVFPWMISQRRLLVTKDNVAVRPSALLKLKTLEEINPKARQPPTHHLVTEGVEHGS
ncbi:hypothetical protein V6N12_071244 [Hibiscus sabdariffa]|uniref:Uncharacterized protein n=1 Tax=Hibiscus sabdariffa TaxID=183260 RepID=A0ABR2FJ88_9ROSI